MNRVLTPEVVSEYEERMKQRDLETGTIKKYLADVRKLEDYLRGAELTQERLDTYPRWLLEEKKYKKRSVNTIVVSTRTLCHTMGWDDLHINGYTLDNSERKTQDKYISRTDYKKLVRTALARQDYRMAMLIQTLCHMDIRYAELESLTVGALQEGYVDVVRRKKLLQLEIPDYLREALLDYAEWRGIASGIIFSGPANKALDRSNIWREIKLLCVRAGLDDTKINMQKMKMPMVRDYYPFYPMEKKSLQTLEK